MTCGGTEALYDAVQAVVGPGDEAVIFDPAYDAYEPAVRLAGGRCIRIALKPPAFRYDWDEVRRAFTDRTRLIIINSPQNPSCTVADRGDLDALAELIRDRPITILADEVYEHVLYDGRRHASVLAHAELRERSFAVFSFGKTLHATGWRIGYCVAPAQMTRELRKVHQFNTFSIVSPLQYAVRAVSHRASRCLAEPLGVLPGQARSAGRPAARLRPGTRSGGGHLLPIGGLRRAGKDNDIDFRRPLDPRGQGSHHSALALLRGPALDDPAAPVHRQARFHAGGGGRSPVRLRPDDRHLARASGQPPVRAVLLSLTLPQAVGPAPRL